MPWGASPGGMGSGGAGAGRPRTGSGAAAAMPGVHGHVRLASGEPVPDAVVTVIDTSGKQAGRARTGTDGWYGIAVPGRGIYTLVVVAEGQEPQASALHIGSGPVEREVTLAAAGAVAGTVRLAGTHDALAGATVTLLGAHGEVVAARATDGKGGYLFEQVPPGRYILTLSVPSCEPAALPLVVTAGTRVTRDAHLAPHARLEGMARTAAGTAAADARVMLLDAGGSTLAVATTGPDGRYSFGNLPAGQYTVVASGYPPVASTVTIEPGRPHHHEVRLAHPDA
jgi:hypothetical protein